MRFEVLGSLRIRRDQETISLTSGRQRALLANLLIASGETVSADRLIEAVWGDDLPSDPTNTLQHGVAQLRKVLEPGRARGEAPSVLISDGAGYRLATRNHPVDADEFTNEVERGRRLLDGGDPSGAIDVLETAENAWRGPAYADFAYDEFARAESERLHELRIQSRELLIDARSAAVGPASVVADLEALVIENPYREGLWRRLMTSLYQTGRQTEALRVFSEASRILGDELGIAPSTELTELEEQILLQDPSLAAPLLNTIRHNLPTMTTSFIGRDEALARVIEYVGAGRLTTMLGPGGSGKTRLAIEAAHLLLGSYPDGVWLVRLDDLADAELLVATIGAVVGMPENRDKAVIETLADHLADAQTLLVLDNCEHLVESVATLVDTLLAACPSLVVLATSQDALNVAGEQRFPLPPLGLPNDVDIPFDDLETVPAVALFLARAAAINPGLDTSAATIAAVSNIVDALDGIPLAIELAAARTDLLTPAEIARRLADRFEILGAGPRDAPQRQQTLRDTVEWSYGLLDADEQAFFTALSVFSGGFDVAAAAAITKTTEPVAMEKINRLVQRSLVMRSGSAAGQSRYRLLETFRIFGLSALDAARDLDATKDRHLSYFGEQTVLNDDLLSGAGQMDAFELMLAEQDNLRSAMAWSLESGKFGAGIKIVAWAGRFWDWRGSLAEGGTWTLRFLDAVADESLDQYSFLVAWAGYYAWELGDEEGARRHADRAVSIARRHDDVLGETVASTGLALYARVGGDGARAVEINADIRRMALEIDRTWLAVWADNHDGLSLLAMGEIDRAAAAAEASLRGFRELGDHRATGWALTVMAQVALARLDYARAIELGDEAMRVSCGVGDGRNAAWALELSADAARASGDAEAAARFEASADQLLKERGVPTSPWRRAE